MIFSFQCLKRLENYIVEQNQNVFVPRGLMMTNPTERGFRVVSFSQILVNIQHLFVFFCIFMFSV